MPSIHRVVILLLALSLLIGCKSSLPRHITISMNEVLHAQKVARHTGWPLCTRIDVTQFCDRSGVEKGVAKEPHLIGITDPDGRHNRAVLQLKQGMFLGNNRWVSIFETTGQEPQYMVYPLCGARAGLYNEKSQLVGVLITTSPVFADDIRCRPRYPVIGCRYHCQQDAWTVYVTPRERETYLFTREAKTFLGVIKGNTFYNDAGLSQDHDWSYATSPPLLLQDLRAGRNSEQDLQGAKPRAGI